MSETRQGRRFAAVLNATRRRVVISAAGQGQRDFAFIPESRGEGGAAPAKPVISRADAFEADRTTFALAAIADCAGGDVATTIAMALQRGPVGRDVDPTAGGVLIESGPDGAQADLADLANREDAVAEIEERLSFVDLQLDAGFMRLGLGVAGDDPIVLLISARAESEPSDE